jgi:hypothetical protein
MDGGVRDIWHRKEEIDPSLGSAKAILWNLIRNLQVISALAHRKMSEL